MTWVLAALLAMSALLIGGAPRLAGEVDSRLSRLVPFVSNEVGTSERRWQAVDVAYRILKSIDPTFGSNEPVLQFLGFGNRSMAVAFGLFKVTGAASVAAALYWTFPRFWNAPYIGAIAAASGFIACVMLVNAVLASASANRRKAISRELALGLEMLCIFLEGGQSLLQAFRAFSDVSQEALPRIARIQRMLIAELDNGVPYEKAIDNWAMNLHADEARPLASLFADSLVHGTELVPHLRQFSLDLMEQRISSARASIGAKSSQLTVVMVLFFLPTILAFVVTPAATALMSSLGALR
jgi:pilus assembly protein TadC